MLAELKVLDLRFNIITKQEKFQIKELGKGNIQLFL